MATKTVKEQTEAERAAEKAKCVPFTNRNMPRELLRRLKIAAAMADDSVARYTIRVIERGLDVLEAETRDAEERENEAAALREKQRAARAERARLSSPANRKKAAGGAAATNSGGTNPPPKPTLDETDADDNAEAEADRAEAEA